MAKFVRDHPVYVPRVSTAKLFIYALQCQIKVDYIELSKLRPGEVIIYLFFKQ